MKNNIADEFEKRKPWVTKFIINGKPYGGEYDAANDKRLRWFREHFPNANTILELGSLEGGHTFALASFPNVKKITAVEGREENVRKSLFVKELLKMENMEFLCANLEEMDLTSLGKYDVVFCVGVLYHLPNPWSLLRHIGQVTDNLYLWTHYTDSLVLKSVKGYKGIWYSEHGISDPLSGLSPKSFWPTFESLMQMISDTGFSNITIIDNEKNHPHGPAVTLSASKS